MANQNDIFKRLADAEVDPPPGLWAKICSSLNMGDTNDSNLRGSWSAIQELDVPPPSNLFHQIREQVEDPLRLSALRDFEILPPQQVVDSFFKAIDVTTPAKKAIAEKGKIKAFPFRWAAAAIVVLITGGILYGVLRTNNAGPVAKNSNPQPSPSIDSTKELATSIKQKTGKEIKLSFSDNSTVMIGEDRYKITITDNDFLSTFVNNIPASIPPLMDEKKQSLPFKIRVDQFTAVSVSQPMSDMMKRMYTFKKNGKPTAKAKRAKRKLEKWKESDEKRFDKKLNSNPLDPIDLGDFILH